jgi:hypothetical protein
MKIFKWLFGGVISDAVSTIINGVSGSVSGAVRDAGLGGDQFTGELKAMRMELAGLNARLKRSERMLLILLAVIAAVSIIQLVFVLLIFFAGR